MDFIKGRGTSSLDKILVCPACQDENTHLISVIETTSDKLSEERLGVILNFECESGHRFDYSFQNHKGATEVSVQIEKDFNG